jgi:hypothetical protein
MVYRVIIFAGRKAGITHDEFKTRYEQHMKLVAKLCGDAAPLRHTRRYPKHEGPDDKPVVLAGSGETMYHDVVAEIAFEDEAAFNKFRGALATPDAKTAIEADEAGFWDRSRMTILVLDEVMEWAP